MSFSTPPLPLNECTFAGSGLLVFLRFFAFTFLIFFLPFYSLTQIVFRIQNVHENPFDSVCASRTMTTANDIYIFGSLTDLNICCWSLLISCSCSC